MFVIAVLLLISFNLTAQKYCEVEPLFYGVYSEITLNQDSTFKYTWKAGLSFGETFGTWHREKRNVILNSEFQPKTPPYDLKKLKDAEGISIYILDANGKPIGFALCTWTNNNTDEMLFLEEDGWLRLNRDSLHFTLLGESEYPVLDINVKEPGIYHLRWYPTHQYEYFSNEKWRIRKRHLISPKQRGRKYELCPSD